MSDLVGSCKEFVRRNVFEGVSSCKENVTKM